MSLSFFAAWGSAQRLWETETQPTSQGHLPFEQVEGDIHGNAGVCRHRRRLPVSWHVTINACQKTEHVTHSAPAVSVYSFLSKSQTHATHQKLDWTLGAIYGNENGYTCNDSVTWYQRSFLQRQWHLLNSCSILPFRNSILAASPCTSSMFRGSAIRMSCMMPFASACALKDMYSTCSFTSNWQPQTVDL